MVVLEDFQRHWPTDAPHTSVDFILNGARGKDAERMGGTRRMRLTDDRCKVARSVFQFEGLRAPGLLDQFVRECFCRAGPAKARGV